MKKRELRIGQTHQGIDHALRWDGGRRVDWIAPDGSVRTPQEKNRSFLHPGFFIAAGRPYTSWRQLCGYTRENEGVFRDIYGREVLYLSERYPCFDSYDYATEKRRYRWFFIKSGGKLTRVYVADDRRQLQVTEDVASVENQCLMKMRQVGWVR